MAELRMISIEELTNRAREARRTAADGMRKLELAEKMEQSIDAAAAGHNVADVYQPLWDEAE